MTTAESAFRIDRHLGGSDRQDALVAEAREGLTASPKWLSPKWFYDAEGSRLFDELTRAPEYYQTRAEKAILSANADEIAAVSAADTIVELGSGTSEKTRILLTALTEAGTLRKFVPFDVDESILVEAGEALVAEYPGVEMHGVVGDFLRHLPLLPTGGTRLFAFLGGTIGNLFPPERATFLADVRTAMAPGDTLLLGTDLVKDPARIVPAYDDAGGIGVRFNRNVLHVLNDGLDGDFVPEAFDHVARWNEVEERIDVLLRSQTAQRAQLKAIDLTVEFAAGEELHTEISSKFRREGVERELAAAGLTLERWWTDPAGEYALSLAAVR